METGINYYAARKEYIKLKDIAEASDVAGKVRCCLSQPQPHWKHPGRPLTQGWDLHAYLIKSSAVQNMTIPVMTCVK